MKFVIFGTGGVGAYFGGRLAEAGEDVTFIARGEHLEAIRSNGLRVDSILGDFVVQPASATDRPEEAGTPDCIIVGVKAWQIPDVAEALKPIVGADTFVVPLQNGIEAPGQLASVLGSEHVLGGLCKISSRIAGPGHIDHNAVEPTVSIGELDNRPSQRAEALRDAWIRAGVKASIPEDIHAAMWEKFIFIAAASGVGAVTRAPVGTARSIPETRELLRQAIQEMIDIARAQKIGVRPQLLEQTLAYLDKMPEHTTASMQRDIMEGRPSELQAQNGAVVRLGLKLGIPTPVHTFIYSALLPAETRARNQIK